MQEHSEQLNELFTALCSAHAEMPACGLNSKGHNSKYANLADIMMTARPILLKYGLTVIQHMATCHVDYDQMVTKLCHTSGQWIESRALIRPDKNNKNALHAIGAAITYISRYQYKALAGVVVSDDYDDNDGDIPAISAKQYDMIIMALKGDGDRHAKILSHYNIRDLKDLPASLFNVVIDRLK